MDSKKIALALIILGLLPLTMSMQAIFFSGSEIKEFSLRGKNSNTEFLRLEPDMSPVRVLITVNFGSKAFSTVQRYIEYDVTAITKSGNTLWTEDGRVSVNSDKKRISNQSHYSSLQTFDINTPIDIQFNYQIKEANLRYKGGHITVKRNVSRHNLALTILGLVLLIGGILLFAKRKRDN